MSKPELFGGLEIDWQAVLLSMKFCHQWFLL